MIRRFVSTAALVASVGVSVLAGYEVVTPRLCMLGRGIDPEEGNRHG